MGVHINDPKVWGVLWCIIGWKTLSVLSTPKLLPQYVMQDDVVNDQLEMITLCNLRGFEQPLGWGEEGWWLESIADGQTSQGGGNCPGGGGYPNDKIVEDFIEVSMCTHSQGYCWGHCVCWCGFGASEVHV